MGAKGLKRYENCVVEDATERQLNVLGLQGWKLACVAVLLHGTTRAYLRRRLPRLGQLPTDAESALQARVAGCRPIDPLD